MRTFLMRAKLAAAVVSLTIAGLLPSQAKAVTATEVIQVPVTAKIVVGTNKKASLSDIKAGDHVSIAYEAEGGALTAHHIADGVTPRTHNPDSAPKSVTPHAKTASAYSHVRGIVESVDAQAQTLTIKYKAK